MKTAFANLNQMPPAGKMIPDEKAVCLRVRTLRELAGESQARLAAFTGLTRDQVANIETGRTILGFWAGWHLCRALNVNQRYLACGVKPIEPFVYFNPLDLDVPIGESESFLQVYLSKIKHEVEARNFLLKSILTDSASVNTVAEVKLHLPDLLARLNRATGGAGMKSELAKFLSKTTGQEVPLASVSRWLSGDREPGGEIALQLLNWVEQQERKK